MSENTENQKCAESSRLCETAGSIPVFDDVRAERKRQELKWGEQNHSPAEWLMILGEEVGEANQAALEAHFAGTHNPGNHTLKDYRKELIQVAAVAIAAVESLDRGLWGIK